MPTSKKRFWGSNPWWIPRFFGRVPSGVDDAHLRTLGVVVLAMLVEEYDMAMLTAALKHIAAELRMREADLGFYLGLIRLGALPAFLVVPLADRIGRRRRTGLRRGRGARQA